MIQALIFDCDGTLVDSMFAHYSAWRGALVSQGVELDEQYFYRHAGTPSSRVIPMFAAQQGKEIDFRQALADKEQYFLDSIDLLKRIPHVVQIAENHRDKLKMAVASGGTRNLVHRQLQQIEVMDWFETIVTCEDTEYHKPDPHVFLEAASRLQVKPEHCRVYEDGEPGIEAARRAGMECIDIRKM
ncbi:MAG TPA: HAD family hydrolase [Rhodopirellula sp.]|nr:HAD family hydrolase [Rhodopirellula sp.]